MIDFECRPSVETVLRCISTFSGLSNILLYPLYTYIHNENKPNKCVISFVQLTCPGASWWRSLPMWVSTMKRHSTWRVTLVLLYIFIGPKSEHWQCLSMTDWLTHSRLVDLIDATLACDVTVADIDDVDRVGNSLLQIWKLRFGHKAKFYSDLG